MKSRYRVIGLHGFLGAPKDFHALDVGFIDKLNIFNTQICHPTSWAARFNGIVTGDNILLGYSMGGRLALHCLIDDQNKYKAAIIIAAHPGLANLNERRKRLISDEKIQKWFLTLRWSEILSKWNNLSALKTSQPVGRFEKDFDRKSLSLAMKYFSLGRQDYLLPKINHLDIPILWIQSMDEAQKIHGLKLKNGLSKLLMVKGGHRLMHDKSMTISSKIKEFLLNI